MKKTIKKTMLISLLISVIGLANIKCTDYKPLEDIEAIEDTTVTNDTLKEEVKLDMLFMREEEKLARDVYLYLYELYPLRPFLNISKSEQAHMDAMLYLIDLYELDDPVKENGEGVFMNEELQSLYDELIEQGSISQIEALKVGALIEEVDIIDLQNALLLAGPNDEINRVYSNLCNASENHLRAFTRVLGMRGVEYEPVKLAKEEYLSIIGE